MSDQLLGCFNFY